MNIKLFHIVHKGKKSFFSGMILILCVFLFSSYSFSAPISCDKDIKILEAELTFLRMNSKLRTNGELKQEIIRIYGSETWKHLLSSHNYLSKPNRVIDLNTIHWLLNTLTFTRSDKLRYVWMPITLDQPMGNISDNDFEGILSIIIKEASVKGYLIRQLVFRDIRSKEIFIERLGNEEKFIGIFINIQKEVFPGIEASILRKFAEHLYLKLKLLPTVGANTITSDPANVIISAVHGMSCADFFYLGKEIKTAKQLANEIVVAKISPNSAFTLNSCWSASTDSHDYRFPFTRSEIEKKYIDGTLLLNVNISDKSFVKTFYFELKSVMPLFNGTVSGYFGFIRATEKVILHKDGTKRIGMAVRVKDKDGNSVFLEKSGMKITI